MAFRRALLTGLLLVSVLAAPLGAITAGDVLDKMTEKEQFGYITGAVDTILYLAQADARGPSTRSECILKWFYGKGAPGLSQVRTMFASNRDKAAVGLIKILADRACGK